MFFTLLLSSTGRNRCSIWCSHVNCHGRESRRLNWCNGCSTNVHRLGFWFELVFKARSPVGFVIPSHKQHNRPGCQCTSDPLNYWNPVFLSRNQTYQLTHTKSKHSCSHTIKDITHAFIQLPFVTFSMLTQQLPICFTEHTHLLHRLQYTCPLLCMFFAYSTLLITYYKNF